MPKRFQVLHKIFKGRLSGKKNFLDNLRASSAFVQGIFTGKWEKVNEILPSLKKMIKNKQQEEFEEKKGKFKLIDGEIKPLNLSDDKNKFSILRMCIEMIKGKWQESPQNWMLYFATGKALTDEKFKFQTAAGENEGKPPHENQHWYSSLLGFGGKKQTPLLKGKLII